MSDDPDTKYIDFPEGFKNLRVALPNEIGYVEISTGNVHGPTGFPVIGVDAVSETKRSPATDGRNYEPARDRVSGVILVGRPGVRMLEQQRQVKWFERVIKKHDSGDHSECPVDCPVGVIANYNILVNVWDKDDRPVTIPLDKEVLTNLALRIYHPNDEFKVTREGKQYTVQGKEITRALASDVPRETSGE